MRQAILNGKRNMAIKRYSWDGFPAVWLHAGEMLVKTHPAYAAAKTGDSDAAFRLVNSLITVGIVDALGQALDDYEPTLVSAHAIEKDGVNAIPEALAEYLGNRLGWPVDSEIVQTNVVGHTGADGFTRLARQAEFGGEVKAGTVYCLVDDFVGQGGTLANLRGFLIGGGGNVVGAAVLTGKPYSAILSPTDEILTKLREKHGYELEKWWKERFGFGYECLTNSEGNYLVRTPTFDRIRDRITAAVEG